MRISMYSSVGPGGLCISIESGLAPTGLEPDCPRSGSLAYLAESPGWIG
jgi:hypothetical protein